MYNKNIIFNMDIQGNTTYVNDIFCKTSGYNEKEILGNTKNIIHHPYLSFSIFKDLWYTIKIKKEPWSGQIKNKTKLGRSYYMDCTINPILDTQDNVIEYRAMAYNITEFISPKKKLLDDIVYMQKPLLVIVEIEDYHILRNFHGNKTIQQIENHIEQSVSKSFLIECKFNQIYPLGEGRFAFLKENTNEVPKKELEKNLKYFQEKILNKSIKIHDSFYHTSFIVSYATNKKNIYENSILGIEYILQIKNDFICANGLLEEDRDHVVHDMNIINILKEAINKKNIISLFQPIINNRTGKIEKYESLVRLATDNKILLPSYFLSVAKRSKYYQKISHIVILNSFTMLMKCNKDISINLSIKDIETKETKETIISLIKMYRNDAHRIIFEILEDEHIGNYLNIKNFIDEVRSYGVQIAIDDYGACYSNLDRLINLKPDILKIDGSLIKNIDTDQQSRDAVESIYNFASKNGIKTIAEHVSSKLIQNIIIDIGIDYSQGYYLGIPEVII